MDIQHTIQSLVCDAFDKLYNTATETSQVPVTLTRPEIRGDYTVTLFPFAKSFQTNPNQLGIALKEFLEGKNENFEELNVVGGFLNFTLSATYWLNILKNQTTDVRDAGQRSKYIIEFSSPNTNKPLHLGHVRNMLLGNATSNILKALGNEVIKAQVINDRGIAICKSMLAYERFGESKTPDSTGIKPDHFVGDLYVLFEKKLKEEYQAWQATGEARQLLSASKTPDDAEAFFAAYKNQYFNTQSELGRAAREMLNKWEAGDKPTMDLWNKMNDWVYQGMNQTYNSLGIAFDKNYYESDTYLLGKNAVQAGLEKGIFEQQEDSSVWIDLTDKGLDRKLLLRSDGTSVYMTQDIGLSMQRYDEYHFDQMVYVVADEQNYHFQVLFSIMKAMEMPFADQLYHLSYGMVELPSGKMKSREGTVVDADDLVAEVIAEAEASGKERGELSSLSPEAHAEIYRIIGLAALKYHMIKVAPKKKMIFDPKESVDMQGQTGPYIQNAFVRIQSILRKEKNTSGLPETAALNDQEINLIKSMHQYKETVAEAGQAFDPSHLANYLYALAKSLHRYYHDTPILTAPDADLKQLRLYLIQKVGEVLQSGMSLLGIEMPERM